MSDTKLTRIGIFYDGGYFAHVSDFYLYNHEREARISIQGLHALIRDEVSKREQTDARRCQIVEAHYFRGRFSADEARRFDAQRPDVDSSLYRERKFEDALIKAGVTPHFLPVFANDEGRPPREKVIDVWLALEAFDLARNKGLNEVVLVTGDGDYVPLVRKLNGLGTRVMVTAWDLSLGTGSGTTRTAQALIDEVTYPVMMGGIIDDRTRRFDPLVANLFVPRPPATSPQPAAPSPQPSPSEPVDTGLTLPQTDNDRNRARWQQHGPSRPAAAYSERSESGPRTLGHIANLPYGREFGFIEADTGGERLFFHQTWVEGCSFGDLQPGDRVEFTPDSNPRDGRPVAMHVTRRMDGENGADDSVGWEEQDDDTNEEEM